MHHSHLLPRQTCPAFFLLLLLAACLATPARAAGVLFVAPGGAGARTGANWGNALDLPAALGRAGAGDELWLKQGIYLPTPGSDRSISFKIKSGVAVYGGFAGTEQSLGERNPSAHPSILSGDIGSPGVLADNSYHVVDASGTASDTHIDGVTISGGNSATAPPDDAGGGMIAVNSDIILRHVIFRGNVANSGGGLASSGGNPLLAHVTFRQNVARNGGGGGMSNTLGHPFVSQSLFLGNSASLGGGLFNSADGMTVVQSVLSGNSAQSGGAIFNSLGSLTLSQLSFGSNRAQPDQGGAILSNGGHQIIRNSIVWGNGSQPLRDTAGASSDIRGALVQGGFITGTNILDADPQFADADGADGIAGTTDDNLRLAAGSPAIDAGDNNFIPADLIDDDENADTNETAPFDLDGLPRIFGAHVDLGAYEWQPARQLPTYIPIAMRPNGALAAPAR